MNANEFREFRDTFNVKCEEALRLKGAAYVRGAEDRLANFKRAAEAVGVPPLTAWAIYFQKHVDAIMFYVKTGKEGPEGVEENLKDARNYVDLGLALVKEASWEYASKPEKRSVNLGSSVVIHGPK